MKKKRWRRRGKSSKENEGGRGSAWRRDVHAVSGVAIRVEETEHPAESELL